MTAPASVLVVTGLLAEAAIAAGPGVETLAGGGVVDLAERLDDRVARLKPSALLSFGVARALDRVLKVGDVVVAVEVAGAGETAREPWIIPADREWSAALVGAAGARPGRVAGLGGPADSAALKASLRASTGATIVDMESAAVALVARERGLSFAVLRAVSDTADEALPAAALAGMREDGASDALAVMGGLLRRPWELPSLIRSARGYGRAMARLQVARSAAGPAFAFPCG